jgi:hypothetical protein
MGLVGEPSGSIGRPSAEPPGLVAGEVETAGTRTRRTRKAREDAVPRMMPISFMGRGPAMAKV